MDVTITATIEQNEPPIQANPAAGQKGRASHRITANGMKYYASAATGQGIMVGQTYSLTTSTDGYGNIWINSFQQTGNGAPQSPPQAQPASQAAQQPQTNAHKQRDRSIVLQSILKACGGDVQKANLGLAWYQEMMLRGWDNSMRSLMQSEQPQEPSYPPPAETPPLQDESDPIPF